MWACRNVIQEVHEYSSSAKTDWEHGIQYRTVIQVNGTPAFLVKDLSRCISIVDVDTKESFHYQLNPSRTPEVVFDQIRVIHHIVHNWSLSDPVIHITVDHIPVLLVTVNNAGMMAQGQKHTHCTCLKGLNRKNWIDAEFVQLGKHNSYGMYGIPLLRSDVPSSGTIVCPI
jgi:hypothetical protein